MSNRISIDLRRFYAQINELRQIQGLSRIDSDTVAIQASLRFAVVQRRNLNLKHNSIDLTQDEADVLCEVVEELFKVRPSLKNIGTSKDTQQLTSYELPLKQLYDAIHEQRMIEKRVPIETAVVAVRLGVKFLILRRRVLDFKGELLLLDAEDILALEQILAEQFAVKLPNGLSHLCNVIQRTPSEDAPAEEKETAFAKPTESWMSRILHSITGYGGIRQRLYRMDLSALFSHITQQRAIKGFRYMSPLEMQRRYNERLTLELQLGKTQDPSNVVLTEKQLETVAHVIYKELDVIIPNIKIFISKV
jgi:hypothetical protein